MGRRNHNFDNIIEEMSQRNHLFHTNTYGNYSDVFCSFLTLICKLFMHVMCSYCNDMESPLKPVSEIQFRGQPSMYR